ncbi:MAG: methyltransferase [Myxococcota bacterium]
MRLHSVLGCAILVGCVGCGGSHTTTDTPTTSPAEHADRSDPRGSNEDFSDADAFARMFDDPERDAWQKPGEVIGRMELASSMTAVDLGAGTGYFLRWLSEAVGPGGRVLGLDTEPNMVSHMQQRVERENLSNVEARSVRPDDPGLAPQSVDRVLVVNTWHHIRQRTAYAARLRTALKPGGRIIIVDFTMSTDFGPPVEMRLAPTTVTGELEEAGLVTSTLSETLPHQYIVQGSLPDDAQ